MNELTLFNSNEFGLVNAIEHEGKVLFKARDIAVALGYKNPRDAVSKHCKRVSQIATPSAGGTQTMSFIPESDVIRLAMRSSLPKAEQFQDWIAEEVIPTIMKHGMYATADTIDKILADPDNAIRLLTEIKEERAARVIAEQKNVLLESKIAEDKPKVVFATALLVSKDSILVREMAKILVQNGVPNIGGNRLWDWLRDHGYIAKHSCEPLQPAMAKGYFEIKTTLIDNGTSKPKVRRTTKVTTKGQEHFINVFLAGKYDGQTTINFNE